jgi:hypothetical protein
MQPHLNVILIYDMTYVNVMLVIRGMFNRCN